MVLRRVMALGLGVSLFLAVVAPALASDGRLPGRRTAPASASDWIATWYARAADWLAAGHGRLRPVSERSGGVMDPTGGRSASPDRDLDGVAGTARCDSGGVMDPTGGPCRR
jgi:hypothetical protein